MIARPGDAFAAMRHLLTDNHEDRARAARGYIRRAIAHLPRAARRRGGRAARPSRTQTAARSGSPSTCSSDFALNQPLSPFALAALDAARPGVADVRAGRRVGRSRRPWTTRGQVLVGAAVQGPRRGGRRDEGRGHRVRGADGAARGGHLAASRCAELLEAAYEIYRQGHPWVADDELSPEVGGPRHVRAGDDLRRVRRVLRPGPLRGPGAALPRRRLQGAAPDRARRAPGPRSSTTSSSGSASSSARSTPACSTSGSSCATRRPARPTPTPRRARRRRRARSPPTRGRSGCWSATRCSAGSSWPRCAAATSWASWTPTPAGTPTRWARRAGAATSTSTTTIGTGPDARGPQLLHDRGAAGPRGRCGRSSTTPPATTTGASAPRSTSPPPTRPARRSSGRPASSRSDPPLRPAVRPRHPGCYPRTSVPPSRRTGAGRAPNRRLAGTKWRWWDSERRQGQAALAVTSSSRARA